MKARTTILSIFIALTMTACDADFWSSVLYEVSNVLEAYSEMEQSKLRESMNSSSVPLYNYRSGVRGASAAATDFVAQTESGNVLKLESIGIVETAPVAQWVEMNPKGIKDLEVHCSDQGCVLADTRKRIIRHVVILTETENGVVITGLNGKWRRDDLVALAKSGELFSLISD